MAQHFAADALAAHVFANGDELHLRRDDPLARIVQLGNAFARFGAFWRQQAGEAQLVQTVVGQARFGVRRAALVSVLRSRYGRQSTAGAALPDPAER